MGGKMERKPGSRRDTGGAGYRRVSAPTGDRLYGPPLEVVTGIGDWPPAVELWWTAWRRSPQAELLIDLDWVRLGMVAHLVAAYQADPRPSIMGEIRTNEAQLGATLSDRAALRIQVERAPDESDDTGPDEADVLSMDDERRRRILGG